MGRSPGAFARRRGYLCAFALAALGFALRLAAVPEVLTGTDAVNFALALERFDLLLHQPHFPGYPLYVLCARAFAVFVDNPALALALPGIVFAVPLVLLAYRAFFPALAAAALFPAALIAVHPLLVEVGGAPGSDGLALALVGCAFFGLCLRGPWLLASAALMGLALGVRPSYLPLLISFLLAVPFLARHGRSALGLASAGLAAGVLAWLLPFVLWVGLPTLVQAGTTHVGGHFATFGGASSHGLFEGAQRALWSAGASLLPLAALVGLLAWRRRTMPFRGLVVASLVALPYAGWIVLAQNAEHARHAAPLALLFSAVFGFAAAALARLETPELRRGSLTVAVVVGVPLVMSVAGPITTAQKQGDAVRAVNWVTRTLGVERVLLLGTHIPRLAAWYAPTLRTGLVRHAEDVALIAARFGDGVTVVTTSEVPGLDEGRLSLSTLGEFGAMRVYAVRPLAAAASLEILR